MIKKRMFVTLLLVALMVVELFGPPNQEAHADPATYTYVVIKWAPTPATVCVGDKLSVGFMWQTKDISGSPGQRTSNPPGSSGKPVSGALVLTASNGSLSPNKLPVNRRSLGIELTTYTAKKVGPDKVTASGSGFNVDTSSAASASFDVVKCDFDFRIVAYTYVVTNTVVEYTELLGEGGLVIDETGVVEGHGEYKYTIGMAYMPDPSIKCDPWKFTGETGTWAVAGTESTDNILTLTVKFYPVTLKALNFRCTDKQEKETTAQLWKGGPIDPNTLNIGTLSFPASSPQVSFPISYGDGWASITFIKRGAK